MTRREKSEMAGAVSSRRPGHPRQSFRPPRFKTNASGATPLGRLGKSNGPRPRPNIGCGSRFPSARSRHRACALTGQAVVVAEVRGTPIKGQRWNPPESSAAGRQREWLGKGTRRSAQWTPPPRSPFITRGNSTTRLAFNGARALLPPGGLAAGWGTQNQWVILPHRRWLGRPLVRGLVQRLA